MKIKRFLEKDGRRAMARVRAELGADAVILSNKNINGQIELVAAIDIDETVLELDVETSTAQAAPRSTLPPKAAPAIDSLTLTDLQRELGNLRSILEGELSQLAWRDIAVRPSVTAAVYNRLTSLGFSRTLCGSIVDKLPAKGELEEQWKRALVMLARLISVQEDDSILNNGGIVALVGSTGVGKTTTIAKLAARFVLRHGNKQVALITTDSYRIGAHEQLETIARYLDIPMVAATDGEHLKAALDQFSSRKLVLIDTAGMSQRDVRLYRQFSTLHSVGYNIDVYMVLSATAQRAALQEVVQVFCKDSLAGAMITKLDESAELGGVLDVVIEHHLTLAYVSMGQQVPEDLIPARADYMLDQAIELMESSVVPPTGNSNNAKQVSSVAV